MIQSIFGKGKYIKAKSEFEKGKTIEDCAPLFRKRFFLAKPPRSAKVYLYAPSYAYFYLNGKRLTEDLFISPVSNYDHVLWYSIYDVSSLLQTGENVFAVISGNGWYNVDMTKGWNYYNAPWRDNSKFILSLEVDGEIVLSSDNSWVCNPVSFIKYNQIWSGERVDFRDYDEDWTTLNYDDSLWKPAVEDTTPPKGELRKCECPPIREMEILRPVSITQKSGRYIFDFGKNICGYLRVTVAGNCGNELVIRHAEEIDEQGGMAYNNLARYCTPYEFQTDRIIEGEKRVSYSPYFTYHGFRYVEIEGLGDKLQDYEIVAVSIRQMVERTSDFECGDGLLNFIYRAGIEATHSNMHYSLIDCPTREKLGWLNDAAASCRQTFINFDIGKLYEKWIVDIYRAVRDDGALSGIVPSSGWGYSFGNVCDTALFEIPYRYYEYTGKAQMLIDAIPYFYKNLAFHSQTDFHGVNRILLGDWFGNGYSNPKVPVDFIEKCYEIKHLRILALAESLANNTQAVQSVTAKRQEKIRLFLAEYFDENGKCKISAQTALAFCLCEDIYQKREILAGQLISQVEEDNFQSTCGMVGTQYVHDALTACGKVEYAYRLLKESDVGYKTWYNSGATTLWETWLTKDDGSHNHHMYSCVMAWFFTSLLGINPKANAETIDLQPHFIPDLHYCKGYVQTAYGKVKLSWRVEDDYAFYVVNAPTDGRFVYRDNLLKRGENAFKIRLE